MTDIPMPRLSDSMEEGTILKWLIEDGQAIARGQDLVEIETDKATMTYPSDADGVLQILVAEGETVPVGTVIARAGPAASQLGAAAEPEPVAAAEPEPVAAAEPESVAEAESEPVAAAEPEPVLVAASDGGLAPNSGPSHGEHDPAQDLPGGSKATALARRIALAHDVALTEVAGTGPRGRITRTDVLRAAGVDGPDSPAPPPLPTESPRSRTHEGSVDGEPSHAPAKGTTEVRELSRLQQVIARRMAETKATVPDFQVQTEVVMDAAIALRADFKAIADAGPVPSFNDMIVKACAIALRKHPRANGSYVDGRFELHGRVNIGIAVAAEDALVVPTVTDADSKSLSRIAAESRRLAERVRSGQITPPELSGATFTVSNLGMFGMTAISPVVNSPQAAILGVGAMRETLARVDGEIVDRTLMTLTLTCDHRILYGADAARLLADVKALIEMPLRLAL
jgi:pyruvate dehydrogenase E2 component (dihydrolipoamide acetyltransferase)